MNDRVSKPSSGLSIAKASLVVFATMAVLLVWAMGAFWPVQAQTPAPSATKGAAPASGKTATATFAGGCFWCTEADFDKVPGVISTTSGYIGGKQPKPTYESVSAGGTGHTEAVQVIYDPERVSYDKLVAYFWRTIDPTTKDRQFCDGGSQYRSGIFTHDDEQHRIATASKAALEKDKPFAESIVTEITRATTFFAAENYHQNYHQNNPVRYAYYRNGCGRDQRLQQLWGALPKP
jgi:peptide-methionine (S)-S-oxide reductase